MATLKEILYMHTMMRAAQSGRPARVPLRKPGRPMQPLAIEMAYAQQLRQVASRAHLVVQHVLKPQVPALARAAGIDVTRHDSYGDDLARIMALVRATHVGLFGDPDIERLAQDYAGKLNEFNRRDVLRTVSKAVGVDIFVGDPKVRDDMRAFVQQNVKLIKSIPEQYFDQVESTLFTGLRAGTRVEDLEADIEDRYAVPAARAELIARDQVGKFNGQLAQLRQEELGIEEYTWRTVQDEKVRDTHADLDGQVFRWDEPPVTNKRGERNHPGGDYQCRCTPEPVIKI